MKSLFPWQPRAISILTPRHRRRLRRGHVEHRLTNRPTLELLEPRVLLSGSVLASALDSVSFITQDQSMWASDGPTIQDTGVLFFGPQWDVAVSPRLGSDAANNFIDFNAATSGRIGIDFRAILDPGSVDASFASQAQLEVIEGIGNTFSILSTAPGDPTGSLMTRSPNIDIESNFIFDFAASLSVDGEFGTPNVTLTLPTVTFVNRTVNLGIFGSYTVKVPVFGTRQVTLQGLAFPFDEEIVNVNVTESIQLLKVTNTQITVLGDTIAEAEPGENLAFNFDLAFDPLMGLEVEVIDEDNPKKDEKPHNENPFDVGVAFSMGDITLEVPTLNLNQNMFSEESGEVGLRVDGATNLARFDLDADFLASILFGLPPLGASASISAGPLDLLSFSYDLLDVDLGPQFSIGQSFDFVPELLVTLGFDKPVQINGATTQTHTMPVGGMVDVEFDGVATGESIDITSTYTLANQFTNLTDLRVAPLIDALVLGATFDTFLGTIFEGALFDPDPVIGPAAPLFNIFNDTFTLGGFNPQSGQTLEVDFNTVPEITPADLVLSASQIFEGTPFTLSGSFVDPDPNDTHQISIDWGDGSGVEQVNLGPGVTTFGAVSHTYADDSATPRTIAVTVTDAVNTSDSAAIDVDVLNVAPTLSITGDEAVDEGSLYALNLSSFDPGDDTISQWAIDWGDGEMSVLPGGSSLATHTYADGTQAHTINATATDEDGTFSAAPFDVTVNNVAPTLSVTGDPAVDEGSLYTLNLASSDPGADTIAQWTIDWGDGHVDLVLGNPSLATHTYADGTQALTIHARATDEDGEFAAAPLGVTVNNVDPTAAFAGSSLNVDAMGLPIPFSAVRGQTMSFSGMVSDAGFDNLLAMPATRETFTYVIHWGDGSPDTAGEVAIDTLGSSGVATLGSFAADHVYTAEGSYLLSVTVHDDDGGMATLSRTVSIAVASMQVGGDLAVGGTMGSDSIDLSTGSVQATINGVPAGVFDPTGRLLIFAQDGDDDVQVAGAITNPAWVYAGPGNDRVKGGAGHDVLLGEEGDDLLAGGGGNDLLVGGNDADRIVGNSDDDILIAGRLEFTDRDLALMQIMLEWTSGHDVLTRRANLSGLTEADGNPGFADRFNAQSFLRVGQSVFDDGAMDKLTGASGDDWFFFNTSEDKATDLKDEAFANDLSFLLNL